MRKYLIACCLLVAFTASVAAQSSLGIGSAEQSAMPTQSGPLTGVFTWIAVQQREFYKLMTDALRAMRSDPSAAWLLAGLSFLYGILHAAGPGHGKIVISSYMLANETQLRRGVALSLASSIIQALSAIVIVGLGFLILRQLSVSVGDTTRFFEVGSYALVTALGAWLLVRRLPFSIRNRAVAAGGVPHGAVSQHHTRHFSDGHGHTHDHAHHHDEACAACGHAHMPGPSLADEARSMREMLATVFSVGLRPCTGALVVLTFAFMNGLWAAGLMSAFAMSLGTAITVSLLATIAVTAKGVALRFSNGTAMAGHLSAGIEILGACVIFAMGLFLLSGALLG